MLVLKAHLNQEFLWQESHGKGQRQHLMILLRSLQLSRLCIQKISFEVGV